MEPGSAHGARAICGAKTRGAGTPCKRPAGWGTPGTTSRCSWHGGATPSGRVAAVREEVLRDAATFGVELREVDPGEALRVAVMAAAGRLRWLWARAAEVRVPDGGMFTPDVLELARFERQTVDMLIRASRAAIDSGVAAREVRLAERQGRLVGDAGLAAYRAACRVLEVTPTDAAQTEFARVFAQRLEVLQHEDDDDGGTT